jgi:hypothetical protein
MLFREICAVYCVNYTKHVNAPWQNAVFLNVIVGGMQHWALEDSQNSILKCHHTHGGSVTKLCTLTNSQLQVQGVNRNAKLSHSKPSRYSGEAEV